MQKYKTLLLGVLLLIFPLSTCSSSPQTGETSGGASPQEAQALARDALNRLDGGGGAASSGAASSGTLPAASGSQSTHENRQAASDSQQSSSLTITTGSKPGWVDNPQSVYPRSRFIALTGHASSREAAESNARTNLAGFFRQTIRANESMANTYQEVIKSGVVSGWIETLSAVSTSERIISINEMIGAEVREIWHDTESNVFYAVAVMDKILSGRAYSDLVQANLNIIYSLVNMTEDEKNSLDGYSRYLSAAVIADVNINYIGIMNLLDTSVPAGIRSGDEYRLEAQNIVNAIPVNVAVNNDRQRRIHGAFSKEISDLGFRSGGNNSRYFLNVDVELSEVFIEGNDYKWTRIVIYSELIDTLHNSVLFPYGFNQREGHITLSEAENRAFIAAERIINDEYKNLFSEYISRYR